MTRFGGRHARLTGLALLLVLAASACAYYNTFYMARKYYLKATEGRPYVVEKPKPASVQDFNKSIAYSKKLLAEYPTDKLVDDAYLLWGKALLGIDDPRQTINLLEDFATRFPNSSLKNEALFYLGVADRQARKYKNALAALDTFLVKAPKHRLAPYAYLERSRTLMALDRPEEAAAAATELMRRFPKSKLLVEAQVARADARFEQGAYEQAREDYRMLGDHSKSDNERLDYLMREADCLEGGRQYEQELELLRDALAHVRAPAAADTGSATAAQRGAQAAAQFAPFGKLLIRVGTAQLLSGRLEEALLAYERVVRDYRGTELAAEAQYRIGYAYEVTADDFERARAEYARVAEHGRNSSFVAQANQRITNLDRLAQFRSAGGDSVQKRAEAGFLLAELYLFQLDKPERALEEYRKIEREFEGTPHAAKAINAQAWVLSRKFQRRHEADSLFWSVVHEYPATEAQLAARDYLEQEGVEVPPDLIQLPEPPLAQVDSLAPQDTLPPPAPVAAAADSAARLGPQPGTTPMSGFLGPGGAPVLIGVPTAPVAPPKTSVPQASAGRDSTPRLGAPAPRDSSGGPTPQRPPGEESAPRDSSAGPTPSSPPAAEPAAPDSSGASTPPSPAPAGEPAPADSSEASR